ncbi:hypothetical protein BCR43DRAFT_109151 [Syncephalastrum racemosum]|uniref:Uncharacterized protein n=1 Tax=Syncephalastrum racemosum TaxID=13706 RepID=A0A1X2H024_SYNRA|nr:hypothetical protein BCR43DRAFT_109151 [Syncephalastrum racemosum]
MPVTQQAMAIDESSPELKKRPHAIDDNNTTTTHTASASTTAITQFLLDNDPQGIWNPSDGSPSRLATIKDKASRGEYASVQDYKDELDQAFDSALIDHPSLSDTIQRLYYFILASLRLVHKVPLDYGLSQKPIALFRPTLDGFVFTDAVLRKPSPDHPLPIGIQEMMIHPAPPVDNVPTLRSTVPPPPRFPSRIQRHEDKQAVPVEWLDYGAFSSFAPTHDSNHANVSYENTYMGRAAKRFRKWEKRQRDADTRREDEVDTAWLAAQGLDPDAIVSAAVVQSNDKNDETTADDDLKDVEAILERNKVLLRDLVRYQDQRFGLNEARWGKVDASERQTAKSLQARLQMLMAALAPDQLTDPDSVEKTMARLPLTNAVYRGTLPPQRLFAYHTSEHVEALPHQATIMPDYAKERWRWIDVAPPALPNKTKHSPSSSRSQSHAQKTASPSYKLS